MLEDSYQVSRCQWCRGDELYERYHDQEWGVPVIDVTGLFERLALESMQAGLAWITVLRKREHMRARFFDFDPHRLAECGDSELTEWLNDAGLIRHRGKLQALVQNARLVTEEADFVNLIWRHAPANRPATAIGQVVPSDTHESRAMAKELRRKGYRFVGPTICYAFMQSVGMVNDHALDCWRHSACDEMQRKRRSRQ